MVTVPSLLLPILLSAVFVFFLSFVIHMVLPHHRSDFKRLPSEDQVMDALRPFNIPPGSYIMPHAGSPEAMRKPEYQEKFKRGPVAFLTFAQPGVITMGKSLQRIAEEETMGAQVSIGDFAMMTSLSRKALRHYHDIGILEPTHVDSHHHIHRDPQVGDAFVAFADRHALPLRDRVLLSVVNLQEERTLKNSPSHVRDDIA